MQKNVVVAVLDQRGLEMLPWISARMLLFWRPAQTVLVKEFVEQLFSSLLHII